VGLAKREYKGVFYMNINTMNVKEATSIGKILPNTLIHGNCLEMMKFIPSGSVDLVLCDPPYG
jgi:DNA modification methylase